MKKLFTLLTFVLITAVAVNAQTKDAAKPVDPNQPVIIFNDDTHDFGEINQGDKVSCDFVFKNTGKSDLVLQNVKASCGCTTPYWPKEPIKPGQTSKITTEFNSTGKSGPFTKQVTITSNASEPSLHVTIKGKINVPAATDGVPEKKPTMVMEK